MEMTRLQRLSIMTTLFYINPCIQTREHVRLKMNVKKICELFQPTIVLICVVIDPEVKSI